MGCLSAPSAKVYQYFLKKSLLNIDIFLKKDIFIIKRE